MKNNPERWLAEETAEINEDYNKAVYKIGQTNLPEDAKDLLLSQAKSNKELALKQAKEKANRWLTTWKRGKNFATSFNKKNGIAKPSAKLRIFYRKPSQSSNYRLLA